MATLADKIREARKLDVKIGDITFVCTRATVEEALIYSGNSITDADVCRKHVTGWTGVKESDLVPGGSNDPILFDKDLFGLVISDKPDWWIEIAQRVLNNSFDRIKERTESKKK